MIPRIVDARYDSNFTIWLKFADGAAVKVDLANELERPIFEPLKNVQLFRRLRLDPELRTVVWPNGADLAPEFLRERLIVAA